MCFILEVRIEELIRIILYLSINGKICLIRYYDGEFFFRCGLFKINVCYKIYVGFCRLNVLEIEFKLNCFIIKIDYWNKVVC